MRVEVLSSAGAPVLPYLEDKLVIIIDVLRATSTMVTALANGCQAIIPVLTPKEALAKRMEIPGALLGGERRAIKIEGFDLGNSPFDYAPEKVGGKRVIMTTTNGTRAIRGAIMAQAVWMACFLNLERIVQAIGHFQQRANFQGIVIFCAGTDERFDLPDTLCAGMLIEALGSDLQLNDLGLAARMLYQLAKPNLLETIRQSDHGQRLLELGFEKDINYCATQNILPIVPALVNGEVIWQTEGF